MGGIKRTTVERIAKDACLMLCDLLADYGVKELVVSPGSRNAPMIVALERSRAFRLHVVIDERSAAFAALGMSIASAQPVGLLCTSGTAMLNYGPALAEAYYRRVPLIAITADRPAAWIDQDDSQTIRQPGVYANYIRASIDVSENEYAGPDGPWWMNRCLNDVLSSALGPVRGPVHINLQLDTPLVPVTDETSPRVRGSRIGVCSLINAKPRLPEWLCMEAKKSSRILIIAGFMQPDDELKTLLENLVAKHDVALLVEAQSNLAIEHAVSNIDATLKALGKQRDEMLPDLVISLGGSLLSRFVKDWLRTAPTTMKHWSVGLHDNAVDCFKHLTQRIEVPAKEFVRAFCDLSPVGSPGYAAAWKEASRTAAQMARDFAASAPWSDFQAFHELMQGAPEGWNLQLSNGTPVRYAQLFDYSKFASVHCNRGVSGIDGCTSTAVGFASDSQNPTLLISGDMSASYDLGAFALEMMPPTFRMVVINNGGGGIFRFIATSRELPERERYFAARPRLPLEDICRGYSLDYLRAESAAELQAVLPEFFNLSSARAAVLEIVTPPEESANVLSEFYRSKK